MSKINLINFSTSKKVYNRFYELQQVALIANKSGIMLAKFHKHMSNECWNEKFN